MDEVLILLLKLNAHVSPVKISTSQIGKELNMSQQNASKRLQTLEESGLIERKNGIKLTSLAIGELSKVYTIMKKALDQLKFEIVGKVSKGLGEGGYYISMPGYKKQIMEKLGFSPYPGTLNVKLDESEVWKREYLLQQEPIIVPGFRDGERTYGDFFAYKCKIQSQVCYIIVPIRTHHGPTVIEIISPVNLRETLNLKDNDQISVII